MGIITIHNTLFTTEYLGCGGKDTVVGPKYTQLKKLPFTLQISKFFLIKDKNGYLMVSFSDPKP